VGDDDRKFLPPPLGEDQGGGPSPHRRPSRARTQLPWLRARRPLDSLEWSHFLRRTGVHFAGKCSNRMPVMRRVIIIGAAVLGVAGLVLFGQGTWIFA